MAETITICPTCGLDAPCHSTDRHLAHAEIERLRAAIRRTLECIAQQRFEGAVSTLRAALSTGNETKGTDQ